MQQSQPDAQKRRRVSLSKHRDKIARWVGEDRSDEWIADALGTTSSSIQSFRSRVGISRKRHGVTTAEDGASEAAAQEELHAKSAVSSASGPAASSAYREQGNVYEGVLDQGQDEGYGLWLDPAVADDPLFREGFAGVSDVRVVIERGRIILEPASEQSTPEGKQGESAPIGEPTSDAAPKPDMLSLAEAAASENGHHKETAVEKGEPGRIKWFDDDKGYGFIIRPDGTDLFFHRTEIEGGDALEAGEFVRYEPGRNQRGPIATTVRAAG